MAGPKGSKYFDIFLDYQIWLRGRSPDGQLGDHLVMLLKKIDQLGSIKMAAESQGMSYRKAWGDIREAEVFLRFDLIQTIRGGKEGGLSRLTDDGLELVAAFDELHAEFDKAIHRITKKFFRQLNQQVSDRNE